MRLWAIVTGIAFLVFSFFCITFSIPWLDFLNGTPIPTGITTVYPLEVLGLALALIGILLIVVSITTNAVVLLLVLLIDIVVLIAYSNGVISLSPIRDLLQSIHL
jgi:hypothetical protein